MRRSENFLPFFIVFFGLSLVLILLGRAGVISNLTSFINKSAEPIRVATIDFFSLKSLQNKKISELISENQRLNKELSDKKNILLENKALKDQFASYSSNSQNLIPAKVVGAPGFIPGVNLPEYLIIDKGSADGVSPKSAVILGNYLVGKIISVNNNFSKIELILSKKSLFSAKVSDSSISGIIRGNGNEVLILDNVLLAQELKKDSTVLTKGDKNEKNEGFPPDLIVGKIISVEKKSTDLFQRAQVRSLIDFKNLDIVFVLNPVR